MKTIFTAMMLLCISCLTQAQVSTWDGTATGWTSGNGTVETPYLIESASHLAQLALEVNKGTKYEGKNFKLTANIKLSGAVGEIVRHKWTPIGSFSNGFMGHFDGNGFQVTDMYIDRSEQYSGLFGYIENGSISNLTIGGESLVKATGYAGGIAGRITSTIIRNCNNSSSITGDSYCGGIVGRVSSSSEAPSRIENCWNSGTVKSAASNIGGIIGSADVGGATPGKVIVINCYNTGTVEGMDSPYAYVGGIVGYANQPNSATGTISISNSYTIGSMPAGGGKGAVGKISAKVTVANCYYLKGTGSTTSSGIEKEAEQMKDAAFVTSLNGETIPAVWVTDVNKVNDGYPVFEWQKGDTPQYTITANVLEDKGGTVTGGGLYKQGTEVTLTATATQGYEFTRWNDGNTNNPRTITVNADATFTAGFKLKEHTLTVSSGDGGTVTGAGKYPYGTTAVLQATPAEGYAFIKWNDNNTENPRNVTVTADASYSALFERIVQYTISVTAGEGGTVSGGGTYTNGTEVVLTATASEGYEFYQWGDGNKENPRTVLVEKETSYQATFVKKAVFDQWDGTTSKWTNGSGTENDPFLIESAAQLAWLSSSTNSNEKYNNKHFRLMVNIDLNGAPSDNPRREWTPIGVDQRFGGNFDGNGHQVKDIYVNRTADYSGLFGFVGGIISNLGITGESHIKGKKNIGGIVGFTDSNVINCYNEAKVTGETEVGGIVGMSSVIASVARCYNTGSISGDINIGGIAGNSSLLIKDCYNTGAVEGKINVGGVVGSGAYVGNSYSIGRVKATTGNTPPPSVGALAGTGTYIINCYYLSDAGPNNKNGIMKSNTEMKDDEFITQINGENGQWFKDMKTVNGGYPVFIQQAVKFDSWWDTAATSFGAGEGTEANPYQINSAEELACLSKSVSESNSHAGNYFILTSDIDLKGIVTADFIKQWIPIGKDNVNGFSGNFDGRGHSIQNMYVNSASYGGLFGFAKNANISNINITGKSSVNGLISVGGIVGRAYLSNVSNCCNTAVIDGAGNTGGIAGEASATLINCYNTGSINGSGATGGIVGRAFATSNTMNCYNNGNLIGDGISGGVIGTVVGVKDLIPAIVNCYNTGRIKVSGTNGGTVGKVTNAMISGCYNVGVANGAAFAGYATESIFTNCYYLVGTGTENGTGEKKDTGEMRNPTFTSLLNNDSDFQMWLSDITPNINRGLPVLKWQTMTNWQTMYRIKAVSGTNGTVYGTGLYAYGDKTKLTATANEGYVFEKWLDGNTDNPRTITVVADATYEAVFNVLNNIEGIQSEQIRVYSTGKVIHIRCGQATNHKVQIHDITGKLIGNETLSGNQLAIPMDESGLYIVSVDSMKKKIIIE